MPNVYANEPTKIRSIECANLSTEEYIDVTNKETYIYGDDTETGTWKFLGLLETRFDGQNLAITFQRIVGESGILETQDCSSPLREPEILNEYVFSLVPGFGTYCHSTNVCFAIQQSGNELIMYNWPSRSMHETVNRNFIARYYIATTRIRTQVGKPDSACLLTYDDVRIPPRKIFHPAVSVGLRSSVSTYYGRIY